MIVDSEVFGNQEFMRGVIAGVRYLLVGLAEIVVYGVGADGPRKNRTVSLVRLP